MQAIVYGSDGHDILTAYTSSLMSGKGGNDVMTGSAEGDFLAGDAGDDTLFGAGGDDVLVDGGGADQLDGGAGNDSLSYTATGSAKPAVVMTGGSGADHLKLINAGGIASVVMSGGEGADVFRLAGGLQNVATVSDFGEDDTLMLDELVFGAGHGDPLAQGYIRLTSEGSSTLVELDRDGVGSSFGFQSAFRLLGVQPSALASKNFFLSAVASKATTGTAGNDTLTGGDTNDTLVGADGDDQLSDGSGANILLGGNGNDLLKSGGAEASLLSGGAGNDSLHGGARGDVLDGGAGDDLFVIGGASNGWCLATVSGGDGNDTLEFRNLWAGYLQLGVSGGAGVDTYMLSMAQYLLGFTITDFAVGPGGDRLDVMGLVGATAPNPFGSGALRLEQRGSDTILQFDADGVAGSATFADLLTLRNVALGKLTKDNFVGGVAPDGRDPAPPKSGSAEGDKLAGDQRDDTLSGLAGNDELRGAAGRDVLDGGEGNDWLAGGDGDDVLDGGRGLDTAQVWGSKPDVRIWREAGAWHVQGIEGHDTLRNVERLALNDTSIALDVEGIAGQVYRLYQAAFDRAPDKVGIGFWLAQADHGVSLNAIAGGFVQSDEFRQLYGSNPGNEDLVARLYRNVLHREGEKGGMEFWRAVLDSKAATQAEVLAAFAESAENVAALASVIANGFDYTPWLG
jgi:Ca2+-binding RTX toxin-like protein